MGLTGATYLKIYVFLVLHAFHRSAASMANDIPSLIQRYESIERGKCSHYDEFMSNISTMRGSSSSTFMCMSIRVCVSLMSRMSVNFCSTLGNMS